MSQSNSLEQVPPPPARHNPAATLFVAGLVPIALSVSAAATGIWGNDQAVSRTAWIAVAVVGTATMVSAAVSTRPRRKPPRKRIQCEDK